MNEQLLYTSELKNPQKEAMARKKERVEKVLDQLSLRGCRDIIIGSALKRGISGKYAHVHCMQKVHSVPRRSVIVSLYSSFLQLDCGACLHRDKIILHAWIAMQMP